MEEAASLSHASSKSHEAQSALGEVGTKGNPHLSIAVIIPAYNAAAYLEEAIGSALSQTLAAVQVIVVDDGSTDDTAAGAEKFGDAVMLTRQPNSGVSVARNLGAQQIAAEWLLFLDADDRLRPDALSLLAARAVIGEFGVVYGMSADFENARVIREHGNGAMQGAVPLPARVAFWKAPIATPGAAMIRRDVFERVGGWDARFNTTADRDLWCRIGTQAEFGFVEQVVVERRIHDSNMSGDKNRARRQAVEVQLRFLEWCAARGLDTAFLETSEKEIFERNAARAMDERAFIAAEWIAAEAAQRNISSDTLNRARRLAAMPSFSRELELKVRGIFS